MDVHLAEDAKRRNVQDEHDEVDAEEEPGFDQWKHADDGPEGRKSAGDGRVHPFGVVLDTRRVGASQILRIEADNDDTHDKLEEAHEDAEDGARRHASPQGIREANFLALHGAAREEFESHDVSYSLCYSAVSYSLCYWV